MRETRVPHYEEEIKQKDQQRPQENKSVRTEIGTAICLLFKKHHVRERFVVPQDDKQQYKH